MFSPGYWTHRRFMDVFIEVLSVPYQCPNYTKLKIKWHNKGQANSPYLISDKHQKIVIMSSDYKHWKKIEIKKG